MEGGGRKGAESGGLAEVICGGPVRRLDEEHQGGEVGVLVLGVEGGVAERERRR